LVGRVRVIGYLNRWLLGLQEELAGTTDAEAVVRGLGGRADADGVLVDDVFVCLGITPLVVHVPAKGLEKRIDELPTELGFVVGFR